VPDAIRIGDPEIEVVLRRNARARRMVLRVAQSGRGPTLTLPPGVAIAQARAFLTDQEGWLRGHLARGPGRRPIEEGTVLPFGDDTLTLRGHEGRRIVRAGAELLIPGSPDRFGPRAAAWLREEARRTCVAGVDRHAARLGRQPGRIRLGDPRARWGSCTSAGDLMFSWRLVMAPSAVFDYVIAHEVAHLAELNHSPRFWAVVRTLAPDYEPARDWLRRNGAGLHSHDFGVAPA
jgi:predicted metal-dependent hydrolase